MTDSGLFSLEDNRFKREASAGPLLVQKEKAVPSFKNWKNACENSQL